MMCALDKLQQLLKENNGIITTKELAKHNIARTYLQMLMDKNQLVRVERGVYCEPSVWDDDMFNLQYRFARGVFSHNTALFLHGLTDRTPLQYEMTFPQGYNSSGPKTAFIKLRTVSPTIHNLGVVEKETPSGNKVLTYDVERTLCDMVKNNKTDKQILLPALKEYISGKEKNISKLMQYAKALKVENKMRTYLEVLL